MNSVISVIVPVYNAETTIVRCIESVLKQTYSFFELILVDDGSTDLSGKRCDYYAENDSRIRVFHQSNRGVSAARNTGLDHAIGQYVFFLDSDDELYPDTLSRYSELADQYDAEAVLGSVELITEGSGKVLGYASDKLYGFEIWEDICLDSQPFGWAGGKMFTRGIIGETQFDEQMISQEDLSFNLDVYNRCRHIVCTSFAGYKYYYSGGKRNLQTANYVSNQLKLLHYAEENHAISSKAKKAVLERVTVLVYTALYNTDSKKQYYELADEFCGLEGCISALKEAEANHTKHSALLGLIVNKSYALSYLMMRFRKTAAGIVRSFK